MTQALFFLTTLLAIVPLIHGDHGDSHNDTTMLSTTEDMPMEMSSTYYTSTAAEPLTSLPPLATDLIPDCQFEFSVTTIASIDAEVTVCGYVNAAQRVLVRITLDLPSNRWGGVGFILDDNFAESQRMAGYAIVVPIFGRDVREFFLTGRAVAGFNTPLESSITVEGDSIEGGVRTLIFTRPVTVEGSDLTQSAANLFNVAEGYYFDFANLRACGHVAKIIYAVGQEDEQFSIEGAGTPHAFAAPYRGSVEAAIDEDEEGLCDELDGAASLVIYASAILALIGVMFV